MFSALEARKLAELSQRLKAAEHYVDQKLKEGASLQGINMFFLLCAADVELTREDFIALIERYRVIGWRITNNGGGITSESTRVKFELPTEAEIIAPPPRRADGHKVGCLRGGYNPSTHEEYACTCGGVP